MTANESDLDTYRGVRVLVTGGQGFIGRWVVRALLDQGAAVYVGTRSPQRARSSLAQQGLGGERITLDLSRLADLPRRVREVAPDVIFHVAGYGVRPEEMDEATARLLNGEVPAVLGQVALELPRRAAWSGAALVHVGSQAECGASVDLSETAPCAPDTLYGRSKLLGTRAVQTLAATDGLSAVVARVFNVYGPGEQSHRLLPSLIEAAGSDDPIALTEGNQERDFTYVGDVAEGLLRLALVPGLRGQVMNLCTGSTLTVRSFVEEAARQLQIVPRRLRFGAIPSRPDEPSRPIIPNERLRSATGWAPEIGVVEGIRRTVAHAQRRRGGSATDG